MPHNNTTPWRLIGWDGIRLNTPAAWHPVAVYTDYLLFEENYQPVCGLKWRQIKGQFDPAKILKKLNKSLANAELHPWQIPQSWQPHLLDLTHQGFSWQGESERGYGLLLYEQKSELVLLIQLYRQEPAQVPVIEKMLASLQLHQQQEKQLWSMFDISIRLPKEASLQDHEFLPGSFRLRFSLGKSTLTYYRFKPAAELLRQQTLSTFGANIAGKNTLLRTDEPSLAEWQQDDALRLKILARLRKQATCTTTRLWQIERENVILGLKVQGNSPVPDHDFQTYCTDFSPC